VARKIAYVFAGLTEAVILEKKTVSSSSTELFEAALSSFNKENTLTKNFKMLNVALPFVFFVMASAVPEPFPVASMAEVEITGGTAKATSYHSSDWLPINAFTLGHAYGWHIASPYGMFPHIVWYEFPAGKTFVPARVSFHPDNRPERGPTIWQFVGSNDPTCGKFGHWTVLCEDLSDAAFRNKHAIKFCHVDEKILREFRCLGITVLGTHVNNGAACVRDVRMWKKVFL